LPSAHCITQPWRNAQVRISAQIRQNYDQPEP